MHDIESSVQGFTAELDPGEPSTSTSAGPDEVVATHVLVPVEQVERLRTLARKSRIAQSEYLREAVDDLLRKYDAAVK